MAIAGSLSCHSCQSARLELAAGFEALHRVTSDCKPWPPGGLLAWCRECGLVQTVTNQAWHDEIAAIYTGYTIYHQSGGSEQPVFASGGGIGVARSEAIIRALRSQVEIPSSGRLLDFGCGNGAFLRSWSRVVNGWRLCGSEVSNKYQREIESIEGIEALYTTPLTEIPGTFDLISLIHVLEHIPNPRSFLAQLRAKLNPGGMLLVEVPDCSQNPFMLAVADHCSHFSPRMLASLFGNRDWTVLHADSAWIPKEITLVAQVRNAGGAMHPSSVATAVSTEDSQGVFNHWKTLDNVSRQFLNLDRPGGRGIFGTSIAATWLDAQTQQAAAFFVDEDPLRIGKTHLGRPVVSPATVPAGAGVFLALPPVVAHPILDRLLQRYPQLDLVLP
jgi:SAM-dependent methyltransferase